MSFLRRRRQDSDIPSFLANADRDKTAGLNLGNAELLAAAERFDKYRMFAIVVNFFGRLALAIVAFILQYAVRSHHDLYPLNDYLPVNRGDDLFDIEAQELDLIRPVTVTLLIAGLTFAFAFPVWIAPVEIFKQYLGTGQYNKNRRPNMFFLNFESALIRAISFAAGMLYFGSTGIYGLAAISIVGFAYFITIGNVIQNPTNWVNNTTMYLIGVGLIVATLAKIITTAQRDLNPGEESIPVENYLYLATFGLVTLLDWIIVTVYSYGAIKYHGLLIYLELANSILVFVTVIQLIQSAV